MEDYIVHPGDTLAGIALQRDMTLRELKTANKLWGDAIWPGQKLRVKKRQHVAASGPAGPAGGAPAAVAAAAEPQQARARALTEHLHQRNSHNGSLPLLVRLRDRFEHHDSMYCHHRVLAKPSSRAKTKVSAASRRHVFAAPPELRDAAEDPREKIISVAAVLLRLRPFAAVNGNITLTSNRLMFVPNLQDPHVRMHGATSLQVDLPTVNIVGAQRISASDLDHLIEEDVGLELQEDESPQRFLEVMYRANDNNIVAPREAKRKGTPVKLAAGDPEYLSLYFMISMDGLSVIRSRLIQKFGSGSAGGNADAPELVLYQPARRPDQLEAPPPVASILTPLDVLLLLPFVPPLFRGFKRWFLRYSSRIDGLSMSTLLHRLTDVVPSVLVVLSTGGHRFGAYIGDPLCMHHQHYGSNRLVLFRLDPATEPGAPKSPREPSGFAAWGCTMKNTYFLLVNDRGISIGADDAGNVGLFIDRELNSGETHPCSTFDNESLLGAHGGYSFTVSALEVYAFEPPPRE